MILILHRIARQLYFLRPIFLGLASLLAGVFCFLILSNKPIDDIYLLACAAFMGWCFCLYGISSAFNQLPSKITDSDGIFKRIKKRLSFLIAWVLALLFVVCTLGLLYITYFAVSFSLTHR